MVTHFLHLQSKKMVELARDELEFSREWIVTLGKKHKGVVPHHCKVEIEINDDGDVKFVLLPGEGDTWVNGDVLEGRQELVDGDVLSLGSRKGGAIFQFSDSAQKQKRMDTQRIKMLGINKVKNKAEEMTKEFFAGCASKTLVGFCDYLLKFLEDKFRINRGVVYRMVGKKGIPIRAKSNSGGVVPPRSIVDKVWESRRPERFSISEVIDVSDLSVSIRQNKVMSAICFPLVFDDEVIALLYIDTQDEKVTLNNNDMIVLCTLIPAAGGMLRLLLERENSEEENLKVLTSLCPNDYSPVFDYYAVNKKFSNGVSFFRRNNDIDFCFYLRIKLKTGKDINMNLVIAFYTEFITVIRYADLKVETVEDDVYRIFNDMKERHPSLTYELGVMVSDGKKVWFHGKGDLSLVVKHPDVEKKEAFIIDAEKSPDFNVMYEQTSHKESMYILSGNSREEMCSLLESTTDVLSIAGTLTKKFKGGVLCVRGGQDGI